jgi:hypothetical protein
MVPDLAYFLPLGIRRGQSHSLAGLVWFCLPAGVLAWGLYRLFLRPLAVAVAPSAVARRLGPAPPIVNSVAGLFGVMASVLVGALTHVLWDSFTHGSGYMVRTFPLLRARVELIDGLTPHVYALLFHASTVGGLGALAFGGLRWYRNAAVGDLPLRRPLPRWFRGGVFLAIAVPCLAAVLYALWPHVDVAAGEFPGLRAIRRAVLTSGTVFLVTVTLAALAWRVMWMARTGSEGPEQRRHGSEG